MRFSNLSESMCSPWLYMDLPMISSLIFLKRLSNLKSIKDIAIVSTEMKKLEYIFNVWQYINKNQNRKKLEFLLEHISSIIASFPTDCTRLRTFLFFHFSMLPPKKKLSTEETGEYKTTQIQIKAEYRYRYILFFPSIFLMFMDRSTDIYKYGKNLPELIEIFLYYRFWR